MTNLSLIKDEINDLNNDVFHLFQKEYLDLKQYTHLNRLSVHCSLSLVKMARREARKKLFFYYISGLFIVAIFDPTINRAIKAHKLTLVICRLRLQAYKLDNRPMKRNRRTIGRFKRAKRWNMALLLVGSLTYLGFLLTLTKLL